MISDIKMPLITNEGKTLLICFGEKEIQVNIGENETVVKYEYDHVRIEYNFTESQIISTIIRSRYSQNETEAIMFNYLKTNDINKDKHVKEYDDLQNWRDNAKKIAKEIIIELNH